MSFKITVDKDECIGCGHCVTECDNFEMKGGISAPLKEEVEEVGCNQQAADTCPVSAIKIKEIK